jgi:hypothetical protein
MEMEKGLLPNDEKLIGAMVRNICFGNANRYFGLPAAVPNSANTLAGSKV